ncbi:MAG TPA: helix-turn-helix transcriptional regulator [Ktedonobacteraceae bacterium]|nr:helix-turn-helix transcriptional regulator [Ktedonobacteraceae bacterium]
MIHLRAKEVLQEKKISQGLLSREAKIPINLVRRMVNDPKYMPNSSTLYKAARFLKVHMEDLLYDDEKEGSA